MKNKIKVLFIILIVSLSFSGCGSIKMNTAESNKLKVMTTLFPYYDFIRQIAGDKVELILLLPAGKEAHSFEPTPSDYINIQNSDLFIYNGGSLETWVPQVFKSIDKTHIKTMAMMDVVDSREEEHVEGMNEAWHADEHTDIEYDEHIWTSPQNAIQIVDAITALLIEADPKNSDTYNENYAAYIRKLTDLDEEITQIVNNSSKKTLVFGDKFPLLYFVKDYGLEYRAAFSGCSTHTEPSVKTLTYLIDLIKTNHIPVVYYLELSSHRTADAISKATGAKTLLFHSCHNVSSEDFKNGVTYLELMEQNVKNLKEGLK